MGYHEDNATFMMYKEWEDFFNSLDSDEERAALIMAIFAFASRNEIPDFKGALKMTFLMMSKQLDRDGTKWEKKCAKNAENVRKRWEKANTKENDGIRSNTNVYEPIRTDTNYTDKDKDKDKDKVKENISSNAKAFERIWEDYPRKQGHKEALAAFERSIKHGASIEDIHKGVLRYKEHIEKCKIEKQYIKQGSTYFKQEAWQDVYDDSSAATTEPKKKTSYDLSKVIPAIPTN